MPLKSRERLRDRPEMLYFVSLGLLHIFPQRPFTDNKRTHSAMRGSGGTDGGVGQFLMGFGLAALAVYLFFDSVQVMTGGSGMMSGMLRGRGGGGNGGMGQTTSMGILFVPFFIGIFALFVNSRQKWAWGLTYLGIAILAIEIVSRIQFHVNSKLTHLLMMLTLFAAGCALMFRSYREDALSGVTSDSPEQQQADNET